MPLPVSRFEAAIMPSALRRINILEPLSTATQLCSAFIPRPQYTFAHETGAEKLPGPG